MGDYYTSGDYLGMGLRAVPLLAHKMARASDGKTKAFFNRDGTPSLSVLPKNWLADYGDGRKCTSPAPLMGVMCGPLNDKQPGEAELLVLDCDAETPWDMFRAMDPTYNFHTRSVGKAGGTIFYLLPLELAEVRKVAIKEGTLELDIMLQQSSGRPSMVYLPTPANGTKVGVPATANLSLPPSSVVDLVKALAKAAMAPSSSPNSIGSSSRYTNNATLVQGFVELVKQDNTYIKLDMGALPDDGQVVKKIFKVFTPKTFRSDVYVDQGWLHPNDPSIEGLSSFFTSVSAIAGSDASISPELYVDFMACLNAQVDEPIESSRFLTTIVNPMVSGKASINGEAIWQYNEHWDKKTLSILNRNGEELQYYILPGVTTFAQVNMWPGIPPGEAVVEISGVNKLAEQLNIQDVAPGKPSYKRDVTDLLQAAVALSSVRQPGGLHFDPARNRTIINANPPCLSLQVLRNPHLFPDVTGNDHSYILAMHLFLDHLMDAPSKKFMLQLLAYHGRHLEAIPVIVYIVGQGGTGKSELGNFLEHLFGSNTTSKPSLPQLTSKFAAPLIEDKALMILAETEGYDARMYSSAKQILKTITGEKSMAMEKKFENVVNDTQLMSLPVVLANEYWYVEDAGELGDRRLFAISPKNVLSTDPKILKFEATNLKPGQYLTEYLLEGIKLGAIPKHIASHCPTTLPPVPNTLDKQEMAEEQSNPIPMLQNLVRRCSTGTNEDMLTASLRLVNLMIEHDVQPFLVFMETLEEPRHWEPEELMEARVPKVMPKWGYIYTEPLRVLVRKITGDHYGNAVELKKAFTAKWNKGIAINVTGWKSLGYVRWAAPFLPMAYQEIMKEREHLVEDKAFKDLGFTEQ